jgi:hypothetical protein
MGQFFCGCISIAAVTIDAAELDRVAVVHITYTLMAVDAAIALTQDIGVGLAIKIIAERRAVFGGSWLYGRRRCAV